jgi:trans-2,3-dihydro-3-hydroxyanthranilate isomerase
LKRRFFTLDVFTNTPFAGNPLAVVLDSEGLDTTAMQRIAAEFNLSETVFVLPPRDPVNTAALRIFTVSVELPFAGHPTVGSAVLLAQLRAPEMLKGAGGLRIVLEEQGGNVPCDVRSIAGQGTRAVFSAPKLSRRIERAVDLDLAARCIGVDRSAIGFNQHVVSLWDAGLSYLCLPVKTLDDLAKAHIADSGLWASAFGMSLQGERAVSIYVYTRGLEGGAHDVRARMFMPGFALPEDPATGSAVAAFAGAAVAFEQPADGTHQLLIGQGYEMGRPSDIALDVDVENGALTGVRIGGAAVIMSEGFLYA